MPVAAGGPLRIDGPEAFAKAFGVSRETADKLEIYADLLRRWQKAVNLVAPATLDHVWHRHFADSAQIAALVPAQARCLVDLGSGGGFPGLVVALLLSERREMRVILVESDQRKAAFLREVARQTRGSVEILSTRIENPETQSKIAPVDVVTARALAPLGRLFEWTAPLFSASTVGLFLKGRDVQSEIDEASTSWRFEVVLHPSLTEAGGQVAEIRHLAAKTEG